MNVYDFKVKARDGRDVELKDFAGKVLLIVNTATECGFTPQYTDLQNMYAELHERAWRFWISLAISSTVRLPETMKRFTHFASEDSELNSISFLR